MGHIKYVVSINGKENTLTYAPDYGNKVYVYKDGGDNRHSFPVPLARYELNTPIIANSNTYIIKTKP